MGEGGQRECALPGCGGDTLGAKQEAWASAGDVEVTRWENRRGKGSPAPGLLAELWRPSGGGNSRVLLQPQGLGFVCFFFVATSGARLQKTRQFCGEKKIVKINK